MAGQNGIKASMQRLAKAIQEVPAKGAFAIQDRLVRTPRCDGRAQHRQHIERETCSRAWRQGEETGRAWREGEEEVDYVRWQLGTNCSEPNSLSVQAQP
jgi:hypothetical protein